MASIPATVPESRKSILCRFFAKGACKNGDLCCFSHNAADVAVAAAVLPTAANGVTAPQSHDALAAAAHLPARVSLLPVPYYSIDVECVATSSKHNGRSTAQIALVDQYAQPILNLYVKPAEEVVSYLTPLTGLTKSLLDQHGMPLEKAMALLRQNLPKNAILVGQSIGKDVEWLQLREGVDFGGLVDLAGLLRAWNSTYSAFTCFSLDHASACWLGLSNEGAAHNAVTDAMKSMQLFHVYCRVQSNPAELQRLLAMLLAAPVAPSFARLNPTFEGVCMGNRKLCTCGDPWFT